MGVINGGSNSDTLKGSADGDTIYGFGRSDTIDGGAGDDLIDGGTGNDLLTGGDGADTFAYVARGFGQDTIVDFVPGVDKLDLRGLKVGDYATLANYIKPAGGDTIISLTFDGSTESITLKGVTPADLAAHQSSIIFNTDTAAVALEGTSNSDVLFGGNGKDTLNGNARADDLNGGAGSDLLDGGTGNDLLRGGAGYDTFKYTARGFGQDIITDFVPGVDKLDLRGLLHIGDYATLANYITPAAGDTVISFVFDGSTESITLKGVTPAQLAAHASSILFNTGTAAVIVDGTSNSDVLFGGNGADTISGGNRDDQINGGLGADLIDGGTGDDLLRGGAGNDTFLYTGRGFGQDTITDFVLGKDKLDLRGLLHIADFATLSNYIAADGGDTVISFIFNGSIETITLKGVTPADLAASPTSILFNPDTMPLTVEGTSNNDALFGGKGDDTLNGGGRADQLNGGAGADLLNGGDGDDLLRGGAGNDMLSGGAGSNTFVFDARGFGADIITDFHIGVDTIDVHTLNIGDYATLSRFMKQAGDNVVITLGFGGKAETITIKGVTIADLNAHPETFILGSTGAAIDLTGTKYADLIFGGSGNDVLFGAAGNDRIFGAGGSDTLQGGTGRDTLNGGVGDDTLHGGLGLDTFVFDLNAGHDTILDFTHADLDKINLRSIDANASLAGVQHLKFVTGDFTAAGQVHIVAHDGIYTVGVNLDTNLATAEIQIDVYADSALLKADLLL